MSFYSFFCLERSSRVTLFPCPAGGEPLNGYGDQQGTKRLFNLQSYRGAQLYQDFPGTLQSLMVQVQNP